MYSKTFKHILHTVDSIIVNNSRWITDGGIAADPYSSRMHKPSKASVRSSRLSRGVQCGLPDFSVL